MYSFSLTVCENQTGQSDAMYRIKWGAWCPLCSPLALTVYIRVCNLLCVQLIEAQCAADERDRMISELRSTCESGKLAELQTDNMLQSLRQKLAEYEAAFGDVEGAASRSELAIVTLQQQARESQQRIVELESQLR